MQMPTTWYEWILTIILAILSFEVLIALHELGHLLTAKAFNVYCLEYSLGFGPKIFQKKPKEGKETKFTIRAIPLGGYVSMYGEEVELEEGLNIPHERSLEGIARYKRAVVFAAGVIVNALLAFTLFFISDVCFPLVSATNISEVKEGSTAETSGIKNKDRLYFVGNEMDGETKEETKEDGSKETYTFNSRIYYEYTKDTVIYAGYLYIVDSDIQIGEYHYVMTYYPTGTKNSTIFTNAFKLYPADTSESKEIKNSDAFANWNKFGYEIPYYPNYKTDPYMVDRDLSFDADTYFRKYLGKNEKGNDTWATPSERVLRKLVIHSEKEGSSYHWKDVGLSFITQEVWLDFGSRMANVFEDFGNASIAVFRGLGVLFSGGIRNMSGFIGIFQTSASILSSYTFSTYLYFWGLISVNLAIFNLLPFPGLDGWSLAVTAVEGSVNAVRKAKLRKINIENDTPYEEWKIPSKVKNIVSYIGLGLIFLLMAVIIVIDILRLFGV